MRRAWAWTTAHTGVALAVVGAFLAGLLIGGVLGWWGLGHRSIDWGTAGEWVGGLVTAAALWWAVRAFLAERRDREMTHASMVVIGLIEKADTGDIFVWVNNFGAASIVDVVVYARCGDQMHSDVAGTVRPDGIHRARFRHIKPARDDDRAAEAWVDFRDVEHRWWRRAVDGQPVRLHGPSPAALARDSPGSD